MELVITLTGPMEKQLQRKAEEEHVAIERIAITLLQKALDSDGNATVEEVVAKIKALPRSSAVVQSIQSNLADALRNSPRDPDFDLDVWEQQWSSFEEELKASSIANDISEGRR